jgi:hypothetical protein
MNEKITETEFKKWSQQLEKIYRELLGSSSGLSFPSKAQENEFISLGAIAIFHTGRGVIQATLASMLHLELVGLKGDVPIAALDYLTFQQWEKKVFQRIKEHCIANGYFNSNSPPDLALLKERRKKVGKILLGDQLYELLIYADSEEYKVITSTVGFLEDLKKVLPDSFEENNDIPRGLDFFTEDLVGRVEKLINKKEQAEKINKPLANSPVSQPPTQYKTSLESEIERLQSQVNELEDKVNRAANSTEKKTYQRILDNTKKTLEDKEKKRKDLDWQEKQHLNSSKNDSKLNWAIGLGIGAITIGLLCFIILLSKRKD